METLRFYRVLLKSLPAQNRGINRELYRKSVVQLRSSVSLKDLEVYLRACSEYNALLASYNIAIPRDMKDQIKHVSRMVGFELPLLDQRLK